MQIEISNNHHKAEEFAAWLKEQGHDITVGRSMFNYVNGVKTSLDDEANEIFYQCWREYRTYRDSALANN